MWKSAKKGNLVIDMKRILTNGFLIAVLYLVIVTTIIAVNEMGSVAADAPAPATEQITPPVESALPDRNITQQRLAPLASDQQ